MIFQMKLVKLGLLRLKSPLARSGRLSEARCEAHSSVVTRRWGDPRRWRPIRPCHGNGDASFDPINCSNLYLVSTHIFSFSRVSVPASAAVPAPTDVTRLDLPAQLKPVSGERFLEPSLRLAFLEPRVLAIPRADPSCWKWARVSSRDWQNFSAHFCAWAAVHRFSSVPPSAP